MPHRNTKATRPAGRSFAERRRRQPAQPGIRPTARTFAAGAILFLLVFLAYLPSLRNGFVEYDDALFVTENAQVQLGLTWHNVWLALVTPLAANWHPLTTLSHMADCQIFGLQSWGHHLTNILLHAAATALLFLVFSEMTGAFWRSALLAALFGLHPLRVESVTWVSERKDVLSALFWMLTTWAYVKHVRLTSRLPPPASRVTPQFSPFYLLSVACFALGLMSKPMLVTLPLVLLLLDFWPLQRVRGEHPQSLPALLLEKLPLLLLGVAGAVLAFLVQSGASNIPAESALPLATRLANALVSYCRYLAAIFWPVHLSPFYPYPPNGWPAVIVFAAGAALAAFSLLAVLTLRRRPYVALGWTWFLLTLLPVIGLVQIGRQSMADHYSYIPSIGILLLLVWGVSELTASFRHRLLVLGISAIAALLVCLGLTQKQIRCWKDDQTLWEHALAVTRNNDFAEYNLASTLLRHEAFAEAIPHFEAAIRINPRLQVAYTGLAYTLTRLNRPAEARQRYAEALQLDPRDALAHNSLGSLLAQDGRLAEALPHFREAIRLQPNFLEAHYDLGLALSSLKQSEEAAVQFREVLRLDPSHRAAREKLATLSGHPQPF